MVDAEVRAYFENRAARLRRELLKATGLKELQVEVRDCPGTDDGLHLIVKGDGLDYEEHVWQEGEIPFDAGIMEFCFAALTDHLRFKRLRRKGFAILITDEPLPFIPVGIGLSVHPN